MQQQVEVGDILTVDSGIIVHGCNAQGVMGSGLARQIKERWPGCFEEYSRQLKLYRQQNVNPMGEIWGYWPNGCAFGIMNCITQESYGREKGTRYVSHKALLKAMRSVAMVAHHYQLHVHYPLIGAGLGGGDWAVIQAIIDHAFSVYPDVKRTLWLQD